MAADPGLTLTIKIATLKESRRLSNYMLARRYGFEVKPVTGDGWYFIIGESHDLTRLHSQFNFNFVE